MCNDKTLRITSGVIVFVSVIFGMWFVAIPVGILSAWFFPKYAELVIAAFVYDIIYGIQKDAGIFGYPFLIGAVIILAVFSYLKAVVRNNS